MKKTILLLLFTTNLLAQPAERLVKVMVTPDHADWLYKPGEPARFAITVYQSNVPVRGATVRYEVGPEKMEPTQKETLTLQEGTANIAAGTLKTAGFLRCTATAMINGKEYRGMATAAYDPLTIKPVAENPADFKAFWDKAKADLAAIPLDARLTLLPERCTETVNVYHVNIQSYAEPSWNKAKARLYGILCVPKADGNYPALLKVPGAGIRPYGGDVAMAEKGLITLEIGIHGVPVNMDPVVYANLASGPLQNYQNLNLDDRDRYYYKRVYLGCVRAVDFLVSLPQYDGRNLAVTGGSQGGALSIITAGLDARVKWLGAYYPALCDITGYLSGRAGGWPHLFAGNNLAFNNKADKIKTIAYYDVVNFARLVNVPGFYSWGYNDDVCPPTSMYAAYNVVSAPKSLELYHDTGHWTYPEQVAKMNTWLLEQMKGGK
jgi:cephalosporin-C deacetylase